VRVFLYKEEVMTYKYMYDIGYKINGKGNTIYSAWYPGNTEEQAVEIAKNSAVTFYNKWNEDQITEDDLEFVRVNLSGDYSKVMKDLQDDRS
jgi:hypothetical protein